MHIGTWREVELLYLRYPKGFISEKNLVGFLLQQI